MGTTSKIKVELLEKTTDATAQAIERLMGQLTKNVQAGVAGRVQAIVQTPDADLIVAREDDEIVGMVVINVVHKVAAREGRIDEVVVDESQRGRGIATILMERAVRELRNRGCHFVEFTSKANREAANKLYKHLGFDERETNVYRLTF